VANAYDTLPQIVMKTLNKTMNTLSKGTCCPGKGSNLVPPKYKAQS